MRRDEVYQELRQLYRGRPVRTALLADFLGVTERAVRYHLHQLEVEGKVTRPLGVRLGWMPLRVLA